MKPLNELKLQIGTPSGTSKIDIGYVGSLLETYEILGHFGVKLDWARIPGCSDLPATRAKIFGNFARSDSDFLLMIDDDMSWEGADVLKMLNMQKDCLAVAGMRKIIGPSEFAFNNCTDSGETRAMLFDGDGLLHVTEIGMAFVMVSRKCALQMLDHYRSELEFEIVSPQGNTMEVDLFSPFIVPGTKRRLPEDYSWCMRYRKIGGEILVDPNIVLGHSGGFVWRGAVADTMHRVGEIVDGEAVMQEGHIAPETV